MMVYPGLKSVRLTVLQVDNFITLVFFFLIYGFVSVVFGSYAFCAV